MTPASPIPSDLFTLADRLAQYGIITSTALYLKCGHAVHRGQRDELVLEATAVASD
jgi:hypothetical protein